MYFVHRGTQVGHAQLVITHARVIGALVWECLELRLGFVPRESATNWACLGEASLAAGGQVALDGR